MLLHPGQRHRALSLLVLLVALSLFVSLIHLYTSLPVVPRGRAGSHADPLEPTAETEEEEARPTSLSRPVGLPAAARPPLPVDYLAGPPESDFCRDRFGSRYLENARDSAVSYCAPGDASSEFTCFWSRTAEGESRVDAMCFGQRAAFDVDSRRFRLACALQKHKRDADAPAVPDALTRYWYQTGPGHVVAQAVDFDEQEHARGDADALDAALHGTSRRTSVLVKREGSQNPWHSLMEIMSTSWSLDVLRMTPDHHHQQQQQPLLADDTAETTQVILLDDHPDGPYLELWRLLARMPVRRLNDMTPDEPPSDIVIPFAGGSNPLWQGDWKDLACHDSALVKTFISRSLALLDISTPSRGPEIAVTLIRRTGTRKLINEDAHVAALRAASIPHMRLEVVDFAALPFPEQIEVVRRTDVLVGVHGAGLTHLLFLQLGSAVVEILPKGFDHKGFRNLAQMLGHGYFRTHAGTHTEKSEHSDSELEKRDSVPDDTGSDTRKRRRDWQSEDVEMDEQAMVGIVSAAVKSLYSKALRSFDVS